MNTNYNIDRYILTTSNESTDLIDYSAVAICKNQDNTFHLGMIYRNPESDLLRFLHLGWHLNLADDAVPKAHWGILDLPEERSCDLAIKCLLVLKANSDGKVPYAFSKPNDFFDSKTGKMLLGPKKNGLTCSTFVLALFHLARITLINYDSWRPRKDDKDRQDELLKMLNDTRYGVTAPEHIKAVESEIDGFRFRPSEVMAASITPSYVTDMQQLEPLGIRIEDIVLHTN